MDKALLHLAKDPVLKRLIKLYKLEPSSSKKTLYEHLLSSIVGQQLSVKAADTIWKRVSDLLNNDLSPENILNTPDEQMRAAGMSWAKVKYVNGIAEAYKNKALDEQKILGMPDEEVIAELTKLKGVGKWTAEMLLIFTLGRQDVFSLGDMGLRNAVSKLYGIDKNDLAKIEMLSLTWKPYRSSASRLLWKSLDNMPAKNKSSES